MRSFFLILFLLDLISFSQAMEISGVTTNNATHEVDRTFSALPEEVCPSNNLLSVILYNTSMATIYAYNMLGLKASGGKLPLHQINNLKPEEKIDILTDVLTHPIMDNGQVALSNATNIKGQNFHNFFTIRTSDFGSFRKALIKSMNRESQYFKRKYYALYTAINARVAFMHDVYTEFNRQVVAMDTESKSTTPSPSRMKYMRLGYEECGQEQLDTLKKGNDRTDLAAKCLLSTNFSPFSNMLQSGEATFQLFLKGNAGGDLPNFLRDFLVTTLSSTNHENYERFDKLYNQLYDDYYVPAFQGSGILLQIMVPEQILDKVTYISKAYGHNEDQLMTLSHFLNTFVNLTNHQENDQKLNQFLFSEFYSKLAPNNVFFGKKHNPETSPINMTNVMPQIRFFLHKDYMNQLEIFEYRAAPVNSKNKRKYGEELEKLVAQHIQIILETEEKNSSSAH